MSLTFILGKPGSGKTFYCVNEILKNQYENLDRHIFYIVPEQFSLVSEKNLVRRSDGGGLLSVNVVGFERLAYYVFAETGALNLPILDETGKNMVIRKIVGELKNKLKYYGSAYDKQGFIDEMSGLISELKKYGAKPEDLQFENLPSTKLEDVFLIYKAFEDFKRQNYISSDDAMDFLSERVLKSEKIKKSYIYLDGFKSFTPQEYKIVKSLIIHAEKVYISLPLDLDYSGNFFTEIKSTMYTLINTAEAAGVSIEKNIIADGKGRYSESPELMHLRDNYYKSNAPVFNDDANIRIITSENIENEVDYAAKLIISLCRDEGYKMGEIGVVCSDLTNYNKIIKAIFSRYKIPVFIDSPKGILSNALTEWVRAIVALSSSERDWSRDRVFRLLKTGLCVLPPVSSPMKKLKTEDIDLLENYAIEYGIKGYKWKKPFEYGLDKYGELNPIRENVIAVIGVFSDKFDRNKKYTVEELCDGLYSAIEENNIPQALTILTDKLINDGNLIKAAEFEQIFDGITSAIEKMKELMNNVTMTVREFARVLDSGFGAIVLASPPPTLDRVSVGDLRRSRFDEIKALVILGSNEGMLPGDLSEKGLFTDDERKFLKEEGGIELSPMGLSRAYEERFLAYRAICQPSKLLVLSRFKGTSDGKAYSLSPVIERIKTLFPKIIERNVEEEKYDIERITSASPMFSELSIILREGDITPIFKDVCSCFMKDEKRSEQIEKWFEIIRGDNGERRLSSAAVAGLYGKKLRVSVSKLEKYVECPFSYFLRYNLRADERKQYELKSVDLGNVFHSALNKFALYLKTNKREWRDLPDDELEKVSEICASEAVVENGKDIFSSGSQYEYFGERVKAIMKKSFWALNEHMNRGEFRLEHSEAAFTESDGKESFSAVTLPLNDGMEMFLEGCIDRIDTYETNNEKYVKIIDYKSSSKDLHFSETFYGLQLQLIIYLDVFLKKCVEKYGEKYADKIFPGAMLYFTLANPLIEISGEMNEEQLYSEILKKYRMSGVSLSNESVIEAIDNKAAGSSDVVKLSKSISVEKFLALMDYTTEKAKEIGNDIMSGRIDVSPYKFKSSDGCKFCAYKAVCRFENTNGKHNNFASLSDKKAMELIFNIKKGAEKQ